MSDSQNVGFGFTVSTGADASIFAVNQLPDIFGIVKAKLQLAANDSSFIAQVFGDKANTSEVQSIIGEWKIGVFGQLPSVQVISAADMNGADGAYASSTQKIYLSDSLFQSSAAPVNSVLGVAGVLTEETFHWLDDRVGTDTQGDEGEFAKDLLFGEILTQGQLNSVSKEKEDDRGLITLGNQLVAVEKSQIPIESLNGRLYQSHRGNDNNIYTRSSTDGVNWTGWQQSGGQTNSAPALAAFNGRLYQSHRGNDNNIYTRSSTDGVNWTGWQQSGGQTNSAPALAALNGKLYQSVRGTDNNIYTRYMVTELVFGSVTIDFGAEGVWSSWQQSGGQTTSAPALAAFNGRLYQSHRGTDNNIYTRSSTDGVNWTGWQQSGGQTTSAPALESVNGKLYQSFRGMDNNIYTRYMVVKQNVQTIGRVTIDFGPEEVWSSPLQAGGSTPTAPSLASLNDKLYLTYQGLDNNIYTKSLINTVFWTVWPQSGGQTPTELNDLTVTRISSTRRTFDVSLNLFDGNGKTESAGLQSNRDTVVIVHGWNGNDESNNTIGRLAKTTATSQQYANANVITLDWRGGASDGNVYLAAQRIEAVAQWTVDRLRELGIDRNRTIVFGHSLGAYVASKIGEFFGGIKEIVALDPAAGWTNLDMNGDKDLFQGVKNFRDVASNSVALVASDAEGGGAGDNNFAATAADSFIVAFTGYKNPTPNNPFRRDDDYHSAVVGVFANQLSRNLRRPSLSRSGWYANSGLRRSSFNTNFGSPHEGFIVADISDINNPKIKKLSFVKDNSQQEFVTWFS